MKKFKFRAPLALTIAIAFALASCSKNDSTPDGPIISASTDISNVEIGTPSEISFSVKTPGGYKSSSVTAVGATATIKSEPTANATTGDVVVTVVGGSIVGAGSVKLTTTDNNAKSNSGTAVISVGVKIEVIASAITANATWKADTKYLLKGNIYVQAPAELTIEPGTVIMGDRSTKGSLVVSRGAKIHAIGTAAKPIVFTSSAPKTFRNYGDWGGVVLLGKAQNNQSADQLIEGISAASGDNGKYGGTADDDNSGELQYARIEFAGIALSTDNELNGLTFGSVGSKTKVDHIQVSYSGDDSYEWFGGTVNTTYLIAYKGTDDEFDTDFGYRGFNQFLVSFRDPNHADKSGSNGFESDNDGGGSNKMPQTAATFSNVTFFGPFMYAALKSGALKSDNISSDYKRGAHIRRNSALKVYNTVFAGANVDGIFFDQTSGEAAFKGNYIARITGSYKPTPIDNAVVGGSVYNSSTFDADNVVAETMNAVDLTSMFAGSTNNLWDLSKPSALLAAGSPLLANAKAVDLTTVAFPDGFGFDKTVKYIGAFDATNNWATASWTNYDPNNTDY